MALSFESVMTRWNSLKSISDVAATTLYGLKTNNDKENACGDVPFLKVLSW